MQDTLGPLFQDSEHRWKVQVDIAAMTMAWGLEIGEHERVVEWVMKELFEEELIPNMEAWLEWAHPGWAFNFSEGYAEEEEGREKGFVPFVNWPRGYKEKEAYVNERRAAWNALKNAIMEGKAQNRNEPFNVTVPRKWRSE